MALIYSFALEEATIEFIDQTHQTRCSLGNTWLDMCWLIDVCMLLLAVILYFITEDYIYNICYIN